MHSSRHTVTAHARVTARGDASRVRCDARGDARAASRARVRTRQATGGRGDATTKLRDVFGGEKTRGGDARRARTSGERGRADDDVAEWFAISRVRDGLGGTGRARWVAGGVSIQGARARGRRAATTENAGLMHVACRCTD